MRNCTWITEKSKGGYPIKWSGYIAKDGNFDPRAVFISVAAKGPVQDQELAGQKFRGTDEQKAAIEAYLKAGSTPVQYKDANNNMLIFTKADYSKSLAPASLVVTSADPFSILKSDIVAKLTSYIDSHFPLPPPVGIMGPGGNALRQDVVAASRLRDAINAPTVTTVEGIIDLVNKANTAAAAAAAGVAGAPKYSDYKACLATCMASCEEANDKLDTNKKLVL